MPKLFLTITAAASSGKKREPNEDTAFCFHVPERATTPYEMLAVCGVAGGMGGAGAGDAASRAAAEFIESVFLKGSAAVFGRQHGIDPVDATALLSEVFHECNRTVTRTAAAAHKSGVMGTTLALGVIVYNGEDDTTYLHVGNVGNSRGYILRGDQIFHATEEDSAAWRMYKKGEITYSELLTHPERTVITVMGIDESISPQVHSIELRADDIVLFCTDGVHERLDDAEIERIIRKSSGVKNACERLTSASVAASGKRDTAAAAIASLAWSEKSQTLERAVPAAGRTMKPSVRGTKLVAAVWSLVAVLFIAALAIYFYQPQRGQRFFEGTYAPADTPAAVRISRPPDGVNKPRVVQEAPPHAPDGAAGGNSAQERGVQPADRREPMPSAATEKKKEPVSAILSVEWNEETERFRIISADPAIVPVKLRYDDFMCDVIPVKNVPNMYRTTRSLRSSLIGRSKTVEVSLARSSRTLSVIFTEVK